MAFIPKSHFNSANLTSRVLTKEHSEYLKELDAVTTLDYNAGNPVPAAFDILIAPNRIIFWLHRKSIVATLDGIIDCMPCCTISIFTT